MYRTKSLFPCSICPYAFEELKEMDGNPFLGVHASVWSSLLLKDEFSDEDIDNNFKYQSCVFPLEVLRIRRDFEDEECRKGWTHVFVQCFLCYRSSWMDSFARNRQLFNFPYQHALVKCSVIDEDDTVYEAIGCHTEFKRASDIACYRLAKLLRKNISSFIMPPYLIGFPNIRGHCFLIAALLPIFYSYPIMSKLFRISCQDTLEVNLGLGVKRPSKRPRIETPRMWSQSIIRCFKDFHKISCKGFFEMINAGYLEKKVIAESRDDPDLPDRPVNPRYDIMLDTLLIRGVCNMLGNYCDTDYLRPGGDECQAYGFIMSKLCSSNPDLYGKLFFHFKTSSVCGNCCNGPYTYEFALPYITCPVDVQFQSLLKDPKVLASAQKLSHAHYEPLFCPGKLRDIDSCEILDHPRVLCIRYEFGKSSEEINVPNKLWLTVKNKIKKYKRLCSSVVIKCYKNEDGEAYPPFYRKPLNTDIFDSWHTYLHFKTIHGWFEVNNGVIYPVDTRLYKKATPGSLHFYQLDKYDFYLPDLCRESVDFFPDR